MHRQDLEQVVAGRHDALEEVAVCDNHEALKIQESESEDLQQPAVLREDLSFDVKSIDEKEVSDL